MKLPMLTAGALAALVAVPVVAGSPKPLGASGGGSLAANSATAEDGARFDCYALDTKPGEDIQLTVRSGSFTPEIWIARGATCDSMAIKAQSEPGANGEASVKFKAAGGRYLVITRGSGANASGTYRIVVLHASDFRAEPADAGSPADSGLLADAGSSGGDGSPVSADDKRIALMKKQVAVRQAQLAEEARIKAEQERERQRQLALAEERRRQQAAAEAQQSDGGGGLFGRALGGFLLGGMLGGGGENAMSMAIAGAQAAASGGNALQVINSVGAASGGGSAGGGSSVGAMATGAFASRPSALAGTGACAGMNENNYREVGLSGGGDVQLKTMCAQSYQLYNDYKNAVAQGYSEADIQRTYAAHQQAAMVAQQFYNETHDGSGGGIQQDTHGPQAAPPVQAPPPPSSAGVDTCDHSGGGSCVTPQ